MIGSIHYDPRQSVRIKDYGPSADKPKRFMQRLEQTYGKLPIVASAPVSREDLYLVHDKSYVDEVFAGTTLNGFENNDLAVAEACLWTVGSMVSATYAATNTKLPQCSPTSGFHHAGFAWGGGYCTFNGLMVAAAKFLHAHPGAKLGILDCDMHYGDGTQDILNRKPEMAKRIIHHTSGKHFHKGDDSMEFFVWLNDSIHEINDFGCDVVLYQAGADMHIDDPLGGLLDDGEMKMRDLNVFRGIRCGVAWNLAGGYRAEQGCPVEEDPVLFTHLQTVDAANTRLE